MSLKDQFEDATQKAKSLTSQSNDNLLELYSLFKQSTVGDVQGSRPGGFDFKGRAKYDAWEKKKGMSQDEAMQAYINLVDSLGS